MFFKIVYYVIFYITIIYSFYFFVMGLIGLFVRNKKYFNKGNGKNNFAILIPARNEEKVIGNLLDSLNNVNYPKKKYSIYVVANNCIDNTVNVANMHGANVLECKEVTRTKGDVLKYAFSKLKGNKKIDAYIIFDADNLVHPDFLSYMDDCLNKGYKVAQGYRDSKNAGDNWLSGGYTLFYLFQNIFFNRARMFFNSSASINGTGFMIKKEVIDKREFNTYTLTEDIEFTGQCALNNERVAFVENAITYDEHVVSFVASWKQRRRWSSGMLECMRLYSFKLFVNFLRTGNMASLDMSLMYLGTIIQVFNFLSFLMIILFDLTDSFLIIFKFVCINLIICYLIFIFCEFFILLLEGKNYKKMISGILFFNVFIFTWIPINIVCLLKKQTKWEEIKHNRSIKIDEIMYK